MHIQEIVEEIDRLIAEMAVLRGQVSALEAQSGLPGRSVRDADYFGMSADRWKMRGILSRICLEGLRNQQWARHHRQTARYHCADEFRTGQRASGRFH